MNLPALLACVAGLMDAPVPAYMPPVAWVPRAQVTADNRTRPWASFRPALMQLPQDAGVHTLGLVAHELAHLVQFTQGKPYWTPEAEMQASWVQRVAPRWCSSD